MRMNDRRTRIDDAIDRAVRDLVRHDPPAGFRRRVLSRLDAPARRAVLWPGLATAAAALAVVTMAVMMRDEPGSPTPAPDQTAVGEPAPSRPVVPTAPSPSRVPERVAPPRLRRAPESEPVKMATFGPRDGRVAAASLREAALPVTVGADEAVPDGVTIPGPPPIAIGSIELPPPLAIPPIVVVPIQIPRMQLAPVSPPR
jgi:hypothetical protein